MSSPSRFEFATAGRVVFGAGTHQEAGKLAAELGKRALLVTGRDPSRAESVAKLIRNEGLTLYSFSVFQEPEIETIEHGVTLARSHQCDLIIGMGGGSAIDAAKAIAAMATNSGTLLDYLEVIGSGKPLAKPGLPIQSNIRS